MNTELQVVGATGFEPATSASRTQRSARLSYAPFSKGWSKIVGRMRKIKPHLAGEEFFLRHFFVAARAQL